MKRRTGTFLLISLVALMAVFSASAQESYTVQPGDTLFSIANQFGVSIVDIAQANNIVNANLIFVGQVLTIPNDGGSSGTAPTATPAASSANPTATAAPVDNSGSDDAGGTYVVQSGDTLSTIALQFQTTISNLVSLNSLDNPNYLFVGQRLIVPGGATAAQPQPTSAAPAPTAVAAAPTSAAPAPTAVPQPTTPPPAPSTSGNILPNGGFEDGWYNLGGIPELQLPNGWGFEWDEGATGYGGNSWDVWVRPETRVLSREFLPSFEHPLYIYDGNHTVKIFKGSGAISVRMYRDLDLTPGTYVLTVRAYPDLYTAYSGSKIWTTDPSAGEVRLITGDSGSGWFFAAPGQKNEFSHTFTVSGNQRVRIGAALRGRYAILNNGWFVDNWELQKVQ